MRMLAAHFVRLLRDQRGATVIEYTFLAALISLAIITVASQIGQSVKGFLEAANRGFN